MNSRRRLFILAVVLAAVAALAFGIYSASAQGFGHITGTVTRSDGTTPIAGVTVNIWYLSGASWVSGDTMTTDVTGHYDVDVTHPGPDYRVEFVGESRGYDSEFYDNVYSGNPSDATTVTIDPVGGTKVVNASLDVNQNTFISAATKLTPAYNTAAPVVATVLDGSGVFDYLGKPLADKHVKVFVSRDGVTWTYLTTMSPYGTPGTYRAYVMPLRYARTYVRLLFEGDGFYRASSARLTILPKVFLTIPKIAASTTRTTWISGYIKPNHAHAVTLEMRRRISSTRWSSPIRITRRTTSTGKWVARVTFTRGTWSVRFVAGADTMNAGSSSRTQVLYVR